MMFQKMDVERMNYPACQKCNNHYQWCEHLNLENNRMSPEVMKEIEELLRDNNLDSIWSREEVRPAMEKMLAALKEKDSRIQKLEEGYGRLLSIVGFTESVEDQTGQYQAINPRVVKGLCEEYLHTDEESKK